MATELNVVSVADVVLTSVLSAAGIYFAHNYARQTRVNLADARRSAYAKLWEATG